MKFQLLYLCLPIALALAGCGQRGPLYLPGNPPPGLKIADDEKQSEASDGEKAPPKRVNSQIEDIAPTIDSTY